MYPSHLLLFLIVVIICSENVFFKYFFLKSQMSFVILHIHRLHNTYYPYSVTAAAVAAMCMDKKYFPSLTHQQLVPRLVPGHSVCHWSIYQAGNDADALYIGCH